MAIYKVLPFSHLTLLSIVILLNTVSIAQPTWEPVQSPTLHTLRTLQFVDSLYGWAAGDSGTIVTTTDGGGTWSAQDPGVETDIYGIHFSDRNHGWAVTWKIDTIPYGTILLKTSDGGLSWNKMFWSDPDIFLLTVYFQDSLNGWISGYEGHIFRTFDGGNEWRPDGILPGFCSAFPIFSMQFYNHNYGFSTGGHVDISGVIWRTSDNGETWQSDCYSPEPLNSMYFLDSANIIAVGGDFEYGTGIIRSSDAGLTWNYSSLEVFGIATAIDFRKPGEAWVPLAYANKIIYSFDTCRTWNVSLFPEFTDFFDLKFIDSTKGFAVGTMGRIYKYTPEIVNVVREETGKDDVPASIKLRNYPNPFSEKTTIEMLLPEDNEISLRLYGVRGELIKELYSGFMESGIHRIPIPTAILSAGVYFVELTSGTEKARTKIVSLRR